jgi:hypothetical protein
LPAQEGGKDATKHTKDGVPQPTILNDLATLRDAVERKMATAEPFAFPELDAETMESLRAALEKYNHAHLSEWEPSPQGMPPTLVLPACEHCSTWVSKGADFAQATAELGAAGWELVAVHPLDAAHGEGWARGWQCFWRRRVVG